MYSVYHVRGVLNRDSAHCDISGIKTTELLVFQTDPPGRPRGRRGRYRARGARLDVGAPGPNVSVFGPDAGPDVPVSAPSRARCPRFRVVGCVCY